MTIEIRQLIIRAIVEAAPDGDSPAAPRLHAAPGPASAGPTAAPPLDPTDRQSLVAACVREVLRELKRASER